MPDAQQVDSKRKQANCLQEFKDLLNKKLNAAVECTIIIIILFTEYIFKVLITWRHFQLKIISRAQSVEHFFLFSVSRWNSANIFVIYYY